MSDEFKAINHGTGQIDLTHLGPDVIEMRPTEIHMKEDGTITNEPSLLIVMQLSRTGVVVGQISLEMLNEAFAKLGYTIIKL